MRGELLFGHPVQRHSDVLEHEASSGEASIWARRVFHHLEHNFVSAHYGIGRPGKHGVRLARAGK